MATGITNLTTIDAPPVRYIRLPYLVKPHDSYAITDFIANSTSGFKMIKNLEHTRTNGPALLGVYYQPIDGSAQSGINVFTNEYRSNVMHYVNGEETKSMSYSLVKNKDVIVSLNYLNSNEVIYDTRIIPINPIVLNNPLELKIGFGMYDTNNYRSDREWGGNIIEAFVSEEDQIIFHGVPVIDTFTNTVGLLDENTKVFYSSSTSIPFIAPSNIYSTFTAMGISPSPTISDQTAQAERMGIQV